MANAVLDSQNLVWDLRSSLFENTVYSDNLTDEFQAVLPDESKTGPRSLTKPLKCILELVISKKSASGDMVPVRAPIVSVVEGCP